MNREQIVRVSPGFDRAEPRYSRHILEFIQRIFAGIFRVYGFSSLELETVAANGNALRDQA